MHTSDNFNMEAGLASAERLKNLRELMRKSNIDAYLIPSGDAHTSEYVTDYWRTREWISGFTGSSGTVVITAEKAGLWTDNRYFIQAAKELSGTGIDLYKIGETGTPTVAAFLAENMPKSGKLGFDGRVVSTQYYGELKKALKEKAITFAYQDDLVGKLWQDRPSLPVEAAFEHAQEFAGIPASEKLANVRAKMKEKKITAYLVPALDDVAWLLNIRGRDIPSLPVVYAYALITEKEAHVFIDPAKVTEISAKLEAQGFTLHKYDALPKFLSTFTTEKLLYNSLKTNVLLSDSFSKNIKTEIAKNHDDIIPLLKAVKIEVELTNIKNAFIKEGAVLVKMLKWLDETDVATLKEGDIVRALQNFRKENPNYLCDSFNTIAAYGENAASAHYNSGEVGVPLKPEGFLLVDTGGQYLDGTTDTTRTIAIGNLTDEMKRDFTLVLKGHIAVSRAVFPSGTTGTPIDTLARVAMWEDCQDFGHGTGHGLGYCLSVHEGPQSMSPRHSLVALTPGMLVTNEPGIYKEGRHGIRTENVLLVKEFKKVEGKAFLAFETLTFCPYSMRAVDNAMLTDTEREWINSYHKRVLETLEPLLAVDEKTWLQNATKAI